MIDLTRREMSGVANNECYAYFLFFLGCFHFPYLFGGSVIDFFKFNIILVNIDIKILCLVIFIAGVFTDVSSLRIKNKQTEEASS